MSTFQRNKISNSSPESRALRKSILQNITTAAGILLILLMIYWGAVRLLAEFNGSRFIKFFSGLFGEELLTDEKGNTQILIVGIGGEGHIEGKSLTDSIMVASLSHRNRSVSMLSIPRDLYVSLPFGKSRINEIYALDRKERVEALEKQGKSKKEAEEQAEQPSLTVLQKTMEQILNISIPYVVKVDFKGFEKIVDSVGGIDVYVEEAVYDPFYPRDGTYEYETFAIGRGPRHMDGKTALKYARSRKTSSDFDRSKRQQQVLVALKSKAESQNLLGKKRFLEDLYFSLRSHISTNMSIPELLSLAEFAADWDSKNLVSTMLNDDSSSVGGFLYTPLRELYGGAFVLVPAGENWDSVRQFVHFLFYSSKPPSSAPLAILNGTRRPGLAGKLGAILHRFGFPVIYTGNASLVDKTKGVEETVFYMLDKNSNVLLDSIKQMIGGRIISELPQAYREKQEMAGAGLVIELGKNSEATIRKWDVFRNVVSLTPSTGTSSK